MSAEQNHEHNNDSPQLSPDQIDNIMASLDALEYFQVTLHHQDADTFRTVDMWSISMEEALSTATVEFEQNGELKRVRITRAHLEEDVGKLTHFDRTSGVRVG